MKILHIIGQVSFTHAQDRICWRWGPRGAFTTRSLYTILNHCGITTPHPHLWWHLPIPKKIRVFMWLLNNNKILTKNILRSRGWNGNTQCSFCDALEIRDHLFLNCPLIQQVWFWLGKSQNFLHTWHSCTDIIHFCLSLPKEEHTSFLLIYSALCWTIWKHRNDMCFNQSPPKNARSIIFLIISLLEYWTGNTTMQVKEATSLWITDNMDAITLQIIPPDASLAVVQTQDM